MCAPLFGFKCERVYYSCRSHPRRSIHAAPTPGAQEALDAWVNCHPRIPTRPVKDYQLIYGRLCAIAHAHGPHLRSPYHAL